MAEIPEPGGDKPAPSGSGLSTVGSGNTGDLSGKTLVGQSSLDTVDLSGTIQDPDAQPANTGQAVPGTSVGVPGGLELPKTPGTFIDLSGIGRPLPKDKRPLDPRPEDNAPLPNPSFEPLDISKFTNPDGTTDWARIGAILSMRAQLKAQERRARRRMQPRPPREKPAQPQGKSEDAQNQGKSQAAKRPGIGNEAGRRFRRYHRAYRQRNSSLAFLSKRGIEVKSLSDIAEKTTPLASPEDSGKTRLPSPGGGVDEKSDRSHATNPREPEEEADFGGAPPVGTKQKPLPSGDKISPSRSEVFRRLAKKPARSRTMQQKLRQWIQDNRSSGKRTAAEKNEGQVERELMNARKRHIAWIEDEKRAANDLIKNETDGNAVIVLNKAIERLDRHLKEASELEEKRANRNILKDHLELETSPTIKRKFQDQLKELNLQIENEEGKERIRLKRHMSGDLASAAEVRKVADMTPAERAAFNARSGQSFTTVASRPPGQLEQSSAERALREKWIREDKPHEDAVMKIEFMSDSKEKMDAWKALQRVRSSLLLKRRKELQKLWRKQADEMKADREFAWSEEEDDAEGKGVPGTEHSSQGKIGDTGSGSGVKDVAQAKLDKAKAQLAKDLEKKQAEEAENAKKIEEAKKLAALKKTPGSPTGMDSLPSYFRQKKQNPPGIEPPRFPDLPGMRGGSGLSGGEGAKLRRPGQPDLPGRGGTAPANPENTTPPPIPVPFTAKTPLSPIQERRSEPVAYETHPGVARFLGNMAAERIRKEMLAEGLESADLDEMKQEVDEFTRPPRTDAATLARNAAAELRRQERIKAAKERLENAAKAEEERLEIEAAKAAKDLEEVISPRSAFSWEDPDSKVAAEEIEGRKGNEKDGERLQREMEEKERLEREMEEKEMLERKVGEKKRRERMEKKRRDRMEKKKLEREMAEKERLEKERLEREMAEKERLERLEEINWMKQLREVERQQNEIYAKQMEEEKMRDREEVHEKRLERQIEHERRLKTLIAQVERIERKTAERIALLNKPGETFSELLFKDLLEKHPVKEEIRKKLIEDELRRKKEETTAKEKKKRERVKNGAAIDLDGIVNHIAETARRSGIQPKFPVGDALKDQEKEVQDYMTKLKNKLEEIALGKNDLEESFEQRERELNEQRIKEESEMRERERERILAAQRKKEEIESKPRKERDLRWILEKEMKELQEAADLEQLGDDEDELSDELSLFQTTSLKLRVPGLSWLGRTDPEFSDEDSRSDSSQHSLFDVTDEDSDFLDLSTPPPGPSDAKPSPDAPGSTRAKAPKEPKIHLHLTIFTSPTQFLSDVSPLHFVCCENVRLSWKISQLIDYLRAPTEVKTNPGKLIQEVPGCVGFRKEDGEVIEEGSWEVKNMRLRIGRRWLDRENRTLLEEGLRDWDNVVVLMVGEGENIEEGDWKDCVWEADGVAGWREGWPGVGKARVPKDREDWVGILWDDYFMVTY